MARRWPLRLTRGRPGYRQRSPATDSSGRRCWCRRGGCAVLVTLCAAGAAQAQFWGILARPAARSSSTTVRRLASAIRGGCEPQYRDREYRTTASDGERRSTSRARPRRRRKSDATTPIVVMGDAMADWLAYGLEDAFSERPEYRHRAQAPHRFRSGPLRSAPRRRLGADRARDHRGREAEIHRHDGRHQRPPIDPREGAGRRRPARRRQAGRAGSEPADPDSPREPRPPSAAAQNAEMQRAEAAGASRRRRAPRAARRHPARWNSGPRMGGRLYQAHRRDHRGAQERRRAGVLGRPAAAARTRKAAADAVYLNELYRSRAEKAGIIYVDIWDGFVDEAGRYALQGPGLRRSDPPAAFRRRPLFHQVRRPQARALRRARDPAQPVSRAVPVALPVPARPGRSRRSPSPASAQRPLGRAGDSAHGAPVGVGRTARRRRARRRARLRRSGRNPRADAGRAGPRAGRPRRRFQLAARRARRIEPALPRRRQRVDGRGHGASRRQAAATGAAPTAQKAGSNRSKPPARREARAAGARRTSPPQQFLVSRRNGLEASAADAAASDRFAQPASRT